MTMNLPTISNLNKTNYMQTFTPSTIQKVITIGKGDLNNPNIKENLYPIRLYKDIPTSIAMNFPEPAIQFKKETTSPVIKNANKKYRFKIEMPGESYAKTMKLNNLLLLDPTNNLNLYKTEEYFKIFPTKKSLNLKKNLIFLDTVKILYNIIGINFNKDLVAQDDDAVKILLHSFFEPPIEKKEYYAFSPKAKQLFFQYFLKLEGDADPCIIAFIEAFNYGYYISPVEKYYPPLDLTSKKTRTIMIQTKKLEPKPINKKNQKASDEYNFFNIMQLQNKYFCEEELIPWCEEPMTILEQKKPTQPKILKFNLKFTLEQALEEINYKKIKANSLNDIILALNHIALFINQGKIDLKTVLENIFPPIHTIQGITYSDKFLNTELTSRYKDYKRKLFGRIAEIKKINSKIKKLKTKKDKGIIDSATYSKRLYSLNKQLKQRKKRFPYRHLKILVPHYKDILESKKLKIYKEKYFEVWKNFLEIIYAKEMQKWRDRKGPLLKDIHVISNVEQKSHRLMLGIDPNKDTFKGPKGNLIGPKFYAPFTGICVASADNWQGSESLNDYKQGSAGAYEGNTILLYNPADNRVYFFSGIDNSTIKTGAFVTTQTSLGKVSNTGKTSFSRPQPQLRIKAYGLDGFISGTKIKKALRLSIPKELY